MPTTDPSQITAKEWLAVREALVGHIKNSSSNLQRPGMLKIAEHLLEHELVNVEALLPPVEEPDLLRDLPAETPDFQRQPTVDTESGTDSPSEGEDAEPAHGG
jgi:hypothetical protein